MLDLDEVELAETPKGIPIELNDVTETWVALLVRDCDEI